MPDSLVALGAGHSSRLPVISPLFPLNASPQLVSPARNRGFKTIQLEVLIEAATAPRPTGLAYLWHLVGKALGLPYYYQEEECEDLLTPVAGKPVGPMSLGDVWSGERSRWDVFLFTMRRMISRKWEQRWTPPFREGWEDVDYWYGPPRSDGAVLDGREEGEEEPEGENRF